MTENHRLASHAGVAFGSIQIHCLRSGQQTISSRLAANAERIAKLLADTKLKAVPLVIHGGTDKQTRNGVDEVAWDKLGDR